ncbi:MAG: restriction endonuclease [Synergistaceae bacterium]|nr:restriction endonuclease [Synergistaceae bacterium]
MAIVMCVVAVIIIAIANLRNSVNDLGKRNTQLTKANTQLKHDLNAMQEENLKLTQFLEALRAENDTLRKSLSEAPLGFPSLLEALRQYDFQHDRHLAYWLKTKSHPAYTAAEVVRIETKKRRDAESVLRRTRLLLEYYFSIFPDVQEFSEASAEQSAVQTEASSPDNSVDTARYYLSSEEYSKLSITQRNQLALDRFWSARKSRHLIGRLYEQYIGWLYEHDGWLVEYFGISEGFSDLGRDLICHKDNTTLIVQCKNWSKSKRIYEKHIFQLFGTTYEYMKNNPFEEVHGVFFTSTQLSGLARSFAGEFHIELHEEFELKRFPIIKCNIGREGEKIYHLPFDQQYYTTRIKPKDGDLYCSTVAEAESLGFRRAYRWHGSRED